MKQTSSVQKTVSTTIHSATHDADTSSQGIALAPPAYGIDVADRKLTIQAKLPIGAPGDQYEQEADRIARQAVHQLHTPAQIVPQYLPFTEHQARPKEKAGVQLTPFRQRPSDTGVSAPPEVESSIQRSLGSGQALGDHIRTPMERVFGADFSKVKVHTDLRSDRLSRSIQAKAFTVGQDIFFRQGAYKPESPGGQELIAHELTHVTQQRHDVVQRKIGFELETAIPVSKYIEGEDEKKLTPRAQDELRQQLAADSHKVGELSAIKTSRTRVTGHTPFLTWANEWHATTDNAGERIGEASGVNLELVTHAAEIETPDEAIHRVSSAQSYARKIADEEPALNRVLIGGNQVYGLPSPPVLQQLYESHPNRAAILKLFENARPKVVPDAMVQVNIGIALSQLPALLFEKELSFGPTTAANLLRTAHKERSGFKPKTKPKEQKEYDKLAKNIHGFQKDLLSVILNGSSRALSKYQKKPYWPDLYGWLSLLTNVLTRATYFPYSQLLKNMTPLLSKSPLHLLFQSILDQEPDPNDKAGLPKAVDAAIGINLVPWRQERMKQFQEAGDRVFARTVYEEENFFGNQNVKIAGKAFVALGDLTIDVYVAELLKGAKGKDLVTQAILHIKPVEGEPESRSSVIAPDERSYQASPEQKEKVALAVIELRSIKGKEKYWPLANWIDYAVPYIKAAEVLSRRAK